MLESIIKKRLEELIEPCRHCRSAMAGSKEQPCVICMHGNKDVKTDYYKRYNWDTFMEPPLLDELVDMRVDSLELEIVELRQSVKSLKEAVEYLTRRQSSTVNTWPKDDLDKRLLGRKR